MDEKWMSELRKRYTVKINKQEIRKLTSYNLHGNSIDISKFAK